MNETKLTGYPSIDKPWLKYYSEEAINTELPEISMFQYIYDCNKSNLSETAINYFGNRISYSKMFLNINKTAQAFSAMGVKNGDVVAVCSITIPEVIYAIYALNQIGAVANMIDPRTNPERIKYYLELSDSKFFLVLDRFLNKIKEILPQRSENILVRLSVCDSLPIAKRIIYKARQSETVTLGMTWNEFIEKGKNSSFKIVQYTKNKPAIIIYTGGTTGVPKGAILSNDTMNSAAYQTVNICRSETLGKSILNIMPPFIAYGIVCGIHAAFVWNLTNVVIPWLEVDNLGKLVKQYKPFLMAGVPMHYERLIESPDVKKLDLSFFEMPICGGDKLSEQAEIRFNKFLSEHNSEHSIMKGYGMTEVGSGASICLKNQNKPGSIGVPFCKTVISIFDPETENELHFYQEGEICFHTPSMMLGYLGNEEETKKVIRVHKDGSKWVHSGDIGYMDEDGSIFIKGRMKRMIIRPDGHNVWPLLIENVILTHTSVKECAVVGKSDKNCSSGKWPVAFIVLDDNGIQNADVLNSIRQLCCEKIPPRDTAVDFYLLKELPHTDVGKIDYRALEKMAEKENLSE